MYNRTKKAYEEILKLLKGYKDDIIFDIKDLEIKAKHHLFGIELKEKYGFNIDPKVINSLSWQKLRDHVSIGFWGTDINKKIPYVVGGRQPKNELLLKLGFREGPYIFGDDYPTDLFQDFFRELKSYEPKYVDNMNSTLYFGMDNAAMIFNRFDSIYEDYHEKNIKNMKQREIKRLKNELMKLEKSLK